MIYKSKTKLQIRMIKTLMVILESLAFVLSISAQNTKPKIEREVIELAFGKLKNYRLEK